MPSFYFEQLLQTGLNGIDQQGITAAVLQIAGVILILSLLWSVYEAYSNGMFNGVADGIYNLSGGRDAVQSWLNSLSQAWNSNPNWFSSLWNMVTGGASSIIAGLITLVGYLILPFTYTLFTLFYALYGSILYVVGPFVLALMPSRGLGQLGRTYFVNMMVFQCWGLLYAIFQALMSALQITNPMQFNGSFLQAFVGSSQMIVMSVACVLLSIMVALIPFIASRIVRGDIGGTLMTVISGAMTAGAVASGLAFSGGGGLAAGRQAPSGGPPSPPSGGSAAVSQGSGVGGQGSGGVGQVQSSGGGAVTGDSRPPTPPSSDGVNSRAVAAGSAGSEVPSSNPTSSAPQGGNKSPSVAGQSGTGYNGRSIAGFAAWQAGHAIGRTMRWAGMGAEQ